MDRRVLLLHAAALLLASPAAAQEEGYDYVASSPQPGAAQQRSAQPVIGLRQRADFLVVQVSLTSDSRDATVRKTEIHTMLLDALAKAPGANIELATGAPVLTALTRENYQNVNLAWAGREDTSKTDIMIKVPLSASAAETEKRVDAFIATLKRSGRGTIYKAGGRQLALRNPGQHREQIVRLIAADARANAEIFGPDYRAFVDGIDRQVQWTQVSDTEVFLYLPYTYRIGAR